MADDVRSTIREFLGDIVEDWDEGIADDANLFSTGMLDSLAIHEMVGFLEDEFSLTFADADLAVDNFASVDALVATVARKRAPG